MAQIRRTGLAGIQLVVEREFKTFRDQRYNSTRLRAAARAVAAEEIEIIRERTGNGLDANNNPFKPLSNSYKATKTAIIANGYKRGKGRGKKRRFVSINPTAFAADSADDFMRLSGRMFSDMYIRDLKASNGPSGIVVNYTLDFKTARSKKIAEYHNKLGTGRSKTLRKFWGAARGPQYAARLTRVLQRALR